MMGTRQLILIMESAQVKLSILPTPPSLATSFSPPPGPAISIERTPMHYVLYVATPSNLPLDRSPLDSRKISTNYNSTNRVRRITNKTLVNPRLFFSLSLFLFLSVSSVQRYAKWTVVARDVCVIRYISYFSILNWRRYLGGFQGWRRVDILVYL